MADFKGDGNKVRCIDCVHLRGKRCHVKKAKVSFRKRRICGSYRFRGEYANRVPIPGRYVPELDKKTKKAIRELLKMGVVPVTEDGKPITEEGQYERKVVPMPASTATASPNLQSKKQEDPLIYKPLEGDLIWTPGGDRDDEPEDNRS